jgi:hypothetical protein
MGVGHLGLFSWLYAVTFSATDPFSDVLNVPLYLGEALEWIPQLLKLWPAVKFVVPIVESDGYAPSWYTPAWTLLTLCRRP